MKKVIKISAWLLATYCLVVALIFFFQESLLFAPQAIFPSDKINDAQIEALSKTIAIDLFVFNGLGHNDILTSTQFQTKLLKWLSSINSLK